MKSLIVALCLASFGCAAPLSTHVTYTTPGMCDYAFVAGKKVQVRSEDGDKTVLVTGCPSEVALLSY